MNDICPYCRQNPSPFAVEIGKEIRYLRTSLGLSVPEFALLITKGPKGADIDAARSAASALPKYEAGLRKCESVGLLKDMKDVADQHGIDFDIPVRWLSFAAQGRLYDHDIGSDRCLTRFFIISSLLLPSKPVRILDLFK